MARATLAPTLVEKVPERTRALFPRDEAEPRKVRKNYKRATWKGGFHRRYISPAYRDRLDAGRPENAIERRENVAPHPDDQARSRALKDVRPERLAKLQ